METIREDYDEAQLKAALVDNVIKFLLELGRGFAFVGKEYPLPIEGTEERIDLLFYHLWLHCYVVVEVKVRAFSSRDIGQTATYVAIADDLIRREGDNKTTGLTIFMIVILHNLLGYLCGFLIGILFRMDMPRKKAVSIIC